jgi:hypothetical protein
MSSAVPASSPRQRARVISARSVDWDLTPAAWIVVAATAIAALLRFSTLGHQSLWVDEATTVHEVGRSFGGMLSSVAHNEATPPLYFACAWVWTRIFSSDAVGIRSLSAVLGTATIPVVYLCGRELISRWAGAIGACLTAISPYMLWYSQEARAYMMLAFFSGLSLLFTARSQRTAARSDLGVWAVVSALALATHFFAVLLVLPEGLWLVWRLRSRAATVAFAAVIVVEAALSPLALSDASHPLDSWIGGLSLHDRIQGISVDFGASQLYVTSALRWGLWGAFVLVVAMVALAVLSTPARRRGLALPAGLAAVIIGVPVLGAVVGVDYLLSRNLTPAWIPLIVVVGGVVGAERSRPFGLALLAGVAMLFIWGDVRISTDAGLQKSNFREAARVLGPATVPRAILLYDGNIGEEPLALYLTGTHFSFSGAIPSGPRLALREIDVVANIGGTVTRPLPAGVHVISDTFIAGNPDLLVLRFSLAHPRDLTPQGAAALAGSLVEPASQTVSVLTQR